MMITSVKAIYYFALGFIVSLGIMWADLHLGNHNYSSDVMLLRSLFSGLVTSVVYVLFHKKIDTIQKNITNWMKLSKKNKAAYNKKYEKRTGDNLKHIQMIGGLGLLFLLSGLLFIFFAPRYLEWLGGLCIAIFAICAIISYNFVQKFYSMK